MALKRIENRVAEAIKLFWLTRDKQGERQGAKSGQKDAGLTLVVELPSASVTLVWLPAAS